MGKLKITTLSIRLCCVEQNLSAGQFIRKKIVFYVTSGSNAQQVDRTLTNGCKLTKFFWSYKKEIFIFGQMGRESVFDVCDVITSYITRSQWKSINSITACNKIVRSPPVLSCDLPPSVVTESLMTCVKSIVMR